MDIREVQDATRRILTCVWSREEADYDVFDAGCSTRETPHLFEFNDGGPTEAGWKFCPYCGRGLRVERQP